MNRPSPVAMQALHAASSLLQAERYTQACAILEQLVRDEPRLVEAHRLLGGALQASGDLAGAEKALRTAVAIDPRWAPSQVSLGELLARMGRIDDAERALWLALETNPSYPRAAQSLIRLLLSMNRAEDALKITTPLVAAGTSDLDMLTQHAQALLLLQRHDEALHIYRHIVQAAPANAVAELNLAAALENAGQHAPAVAAARRAQAKGGDSADLWFVLASALVGTDDYPQAEAAFREAIRQRPGYVDAHRELAQLIWMRTADVHAAVANLDRALQQLSDESALLIIKAKLYQSAVSPEAAYALIADAIARTDADPLLLQTACDAALKFDANLALALAERLAARTTANPHGDGSLVFALLGTGRTEAASHITDQVLQATPNDQQMIALQATAWRLLDDPRYRELYNYEQLVRTWTIDTPDGWPDLRAYLADLAISLRRLHTLHTHPVAQSLRHGTQTTQNLMQSDDPAIRAFFQAIDGPIHRHMAAMGKGSDPLRRRNTGRYKIQGLWSVQLRANGFHTDHVHPLGWLSSACYIDLPDVIKTDVIKAGAIKDEGHPGWLKFGAPGVLTEPRLAAEYFIKPEPGLLALFPSYMWHGTVPFSGTQTRLTIAFDVVPA